MVEIDLVYTWVDGSDQQWLAEKKKYLRIEKPKSSESHCLNRFLDMDELQHSIKSVLKFAKFPIRKIFIVTNGQTPVWITQEDNGLWSNPIDDRIELVFHHQIFPQPLEKYLPTFNSIAIEANLHRIPGLSECFLYLNDDVFFGRNVFLKDLMLESTGQSMVYFRGLDKRVPNRSGYSLKNDYYFRDALHHTHLYLNRYVKYRKIRRTHHHVSYLMKKSVLQDIEQLLKKTNSWEATLTRFRQNRNILLVSLLYPYYALDHGYAVKNKRLNLLSITKDHHLHYSNILIKKYHMFCMNNLNKNTKGLDKFYSKLI